MIGRRDMIRLGGAGVLAAAAPRAFAAAADSNIKWWSSSPQATWQSIRGLSVQPPVASLFERDVIILGPSQVITGFGGAFSEVGWQALSSLSKPAREQALAALFDDSGAAFTLCRTPIGANDFSRRWYTYDETEGDFALKDFSTANDRETLIPFIKAAQAFHPDLGLWASPWSPPAWMKKGKHYAQSGPWAGLPANGIKADQMGREGTDSFIQDDRYFDAYARYFRRYVEDYGRQGIAIGTVMPQNEFNSATAYPSCCWTPQGLSRFLPFLIREMDAAGVAVMLGTLERANPELVTGILDDLAFAKSIKGIGVQWAGKETLEPLRKRYKDLTIWGTEQECGTGTNDWRFARYSWRMMKRYLNAGASVWQYWNMVLPSPGLSTWGWPQNSLISVDRIKGRFALTPDYWVMKHLASKVKPGARFVSTLSPSGFDNQLVFRNPDGDTVIVIQNEGSLPQAVNLMIGTKRLTPTLPPDSFNTIVVPQRALA